MGCQQSKGESTATKKGEQNKVHPEMKVEQVDQAGEQTVASARAPTMDPTSSGVKSALPSETQKQSGFAENNSPYQVNNLVHEQTKSLLRNAAGMNRLQSENKNAIIAQDTIEGQKPPGVLFYFDFQALKFHYYNIMTHVWDSNDLSQSTDDCPRCPLFKYKDPKEAAVALEFAHYMSYITFTDNVIFLIGGYNMFYSCLEYHIQENAFYCREPIKAARNNPSLYRRGKEIFAISGDLIDAFSKDVAKYHAGKNEWTTMPDLPGPQGFASVTCINEKVDPSLIVLGGLCEKFPKTYVSTLSLFSFRENRWSDIDLSKLIPTRVPKFLNCVVVQTKESEVIILGAENSKTVYKFDLLEGTLVSGGKLPVEEVFKESMRSREALWRDNQVYCLSHSTPKTVYKGNLIDNTWNIC